MPRIRLRAERPDIFFSPEDWAALTRAAKQQGYDIVTTDDMVADIKKFCDTLQEYDIDEVVMNYDGSGDSGDGECLFKKTIRYHPQGPEEPTTRWNWIPYAQVKIELVNNGTVSEKALDDFQDNLWSLLPGGWEINDGSYGEVFIDVRQKTIKVEHNERYTEINTTERSY